MTSKAMTTADAAAASVQPVDASRRLASIDQLRGLVMLLMLLDHVRERFFLYRQVGDPLDIATTDPGLAFTRLLAHLCAPTFVFLTGLSAYLYSQKHSQEQLTRFLWQRGLVLIGLEVTLVNVAWLGSYQTLYLQVIWVLGLCMLLLALLRSLPRPLLWAIAVSLIGLHNLLTPIQFAASEWGYSLWTILHDRGYLVAKGEGAFAIKLSYPLLPWIGVIVLGYLAGPLFVTTATKRLRLLGYAGLGALLLLLILRSQNSYGETLPWQWFSCVDGVVQALPQVASVQQICWQPTVLSWLNFTKYPPSLDFLLLTLGLMALLLRAFEQLASHRRFDAFGQVLKDFGAAPMFFYLLHLYLLLLCYSVAEAFFGKTHGDWFGVDAVWQLWLIAVLLAVVLYPATRWFAKYKQRSRHGWVKFL